jgi:hypothetical protein
VKVDCYDWINDRLVFSVLIWPVLAAPPDEAYSRHDELVEAVLDAIAKGAAEKMWSVRWEVYGLTWDHSRKCWVDGDGHCYDGSRFDREHHRV